jgi:hypothetical protein
MLYNCNICGKQFKQKCHYTNHLNRINPCINLTKKIHENPLNLHVFPQNQHVLPTKGDNKCNYCYKKYSRSDVLKNHLLICKVRKQEIQEKEDILNKLLEQNSRLVSTIEELNKRIEKLEKEKNPTQNNNNIKNQNNGTINNTINIIGFGKEDLSKIDNKSFFEAQTQMGYRIPAKMLEKIHINQAYPEYKNIYISDINRGNAMIYDGKKWKLDKYDNISDKLLDKVLNFMEDRYEKIKDEEKISRNKKTAMEKRIKILEIMKIFEDEKDKERHEYLRSQCKEKMKIDLYNNREDIME